MVPVVVRLCEVQYFHEAVIKKLCHCCSGMLRLQGINIAAYEGVLIRFWQASGLASPRFET
jgi:hypothetical protein